MERQRPTIVPEMREAFLQFSRNGRWGTCADCPRDVDERAFPEFCVNTDRYDHQLTVDFLVEQHKIRLKDVKTSPVA
jgi:hypothetical protein